MQAQFYNPQFNFHFKFYFNCTTIRWFNSTLYTSVGSEHGQSTEICHGPERTKNYVFIILPSTEHHFSRSSRSERSISVGLVPSSQSPLIRLVLWFLWFFSFGWFGGSVGSLVSVGSVGSVSSVGSLRFRRLSWFGGSLVPVGSVVLVQLTLWFLWFSWFRWFCQSQSMSPATLRRPSQTAAAWTVKRNAWYSRLYTGLCRHLLSCRKCLQCGERKFGDSFGWE